MNEWLGRQVETSGRIVIGRGGEVNVVREIVRETGSQRGSVSGNDRVL
jgi:hypothetical protein